MFIQEDTNNQEAFSLKNYILQKKIGSGTFGKVFLVKDNKTGEIYASKISIDDIESSSNTKFIDLSREINIISKLNHPSVLKFIGFSPIDFKKRPRPVIITEYVSNGTLTNLISNEICNDTMKLIIIYGIASGMSYLHSHGIIHRDLKPDNILIDDHLFPKIADFGLSKVKSNENANFKSAMEIKGTPIYISPEIWLKYEYGKASDVYAFSLIVYQLLTGEKPFENCNIFQIQFKILNGYRPEFTKPINDSYKNLIESCWSEDPEKRPSFDQIVDRLKNDRKFITEKIDEEKYRNYIRFISESKISFDPNEFEILKIFKEKEPLNLSAYENIDSTSPSGEVLILSKENQALVKEAHNDPEKQFFIGKCFIEGSNGFPIKTQLGVEYLKNSYKSGSIDSLIYYCNLLIKGKIILKNHEKVKKLLDGLSNDQESVSSFLYGKLFENEENYNEAKKYFERSIELGNPEAMYKYGKMIYSGKIQQLGKEEAIDYFMKSIDKGCPKAMLKYGLILIDEEKFNEGIKYVKMAAEKEYPKALYHYSKVLKKQAESNKNDPEKCQSLKRESIKKLEESAKLGNMKGMHDYAIQMIDDNQQSNEELPIYLKKCSDKGDFDSMFHYGLFLLQHRKDQNIEAEGSKFIRIAANEGHSNSMQKYGEMLLYGNGVPTDAEEASKYYKMAIDKGNNTAMIQYSLTFKNDVKQSYDYMKMAADQGNDSVMELYANMLSNQLGTTITKEEAVRYYNMFNGEGDSEAQDNMIKLLNSKGISITKEQMININKMVGNGEAFINQNDAIRMFKRIFGSSVDFSNLNQTNELLNFNQMVEMMNSLSFDADKSQSVELFKTMADAGSPESMNEYALIKIECDDEESKKEAIEYFKKAAEIGYTPAMINYAVFLLEGKVIQQNEEEAARYYKMAADKGEPLAMISYSQLLEEGQGVHMNKKEALKYLKMAVDNGNSKAMLIYSLKLFKGEDIEKNREEAIKYCKMAVDKGEKDSEKVYDYMIKENERILNEEKVKSFKVDENDPSSLFEHAKNLFDGIGVPQNKSEAAKYFKMAADKGNASSMYIYAMLVDNGEGVPEDKEEALKYLKLGVDNGNLESINAYAEKLDYGEGIEMNKKEAAKYYKMAADKGYEKSILSYASKLQKGEGVEINYEESAKYFKMAADKGSLYGIIIYSTMLYDGKMIPGNKEEAIRYIEIAAEKGDGQAIAIYEYMLNEMRQVSFKDKAEQIKKKADEGDVSSMIQYADMLDKGEGVSQNKEEAAKYYKMAADKGNPSAMNSYAFSLFTGEGIPQNKEEATKYFKLAAENGNAVAMNNYANSLFYGEGVPVNKEEALKYCKMSADKGYKSAIKNYENMLKKYKNEQIELYKKQADEGDPFAMNKYAEMLDKGEGIPANKEEAAKYFKMAADKGNSSAMNSYAIMLLNGDGIPQNKEEAVKYFKLGIENGNSLSMKNYAIILKDGNGIPANKEESNKYYKMAADNGNDSAMVTYACMIEDGEIEAENQHEEVLKYFKMAADKGNTLAMLKCASFYMQGIGVQINNEEALKYFKMAADKGDEEGCFMYALMRYTGEKVEKDLNEALIYFRNAANKGHYKATLYMAKMFRDMRNDTNH